MALLKVQLLRDHGYPTFGVKENLLHLSNHLFPVESSMQVPKEFLPIQNEYRFFGDPESEQPTMFKLLCHRLLEAHINVIAEYPEHCSSDVLPYNAVEAVVKMKDGGTNSPSSPKRQIQQSNRKWGAVKKQTAPCVVYNQKEKGNFTTVLFRSILVSPALFEPYPSTGDEWDLTTLMLADGTLQEKFEAHYDIFITEEDIAQIAGAGLNRVRLPIPFWAIATWSDVGTDESGPVAEPFPEGVCWK
ncbi:hypothetical protein B0H13DRAFT_1922167 [Mycena leptocephala]|nr:hypothetical protein B0H13DRAFT_1922167 [Mycena leptocephala]